MVGTNKDNPVPIARKGLIRDWLSAPPTVPMPLKTASPVSPFSMSLIVLPASAPNTPIPPTRLGTLGLPKRSLDIILAAVFWGEMVRRVGFELRENLYG